MYTYTPLLGEATLDELLEHMNDYRTQSTVKKACRESITMCTCTVCITYPLVFNQGLAHNDELIQLAFPLPG